MAHTGNVVCSYRPCNSRSGQGISLFVFPKDPLRSQTWLRACNREDLLSKDVLVLHKNYRLCEKHFENKYVSIGKSRKTLDLEAVPTIFAHTLKRKVTGDDESDIVSVTPLEEKSEEPTSSLCSTIPELSTDRLEENTEELTSFPCSSAMPGPSHRQYSGDDEALDEAIDFTEVFTPKKTTSSLLSPSISTQTPAILSSKSPRKKKLRQKIKALKKRKLETQQMKNQKSSLEAFHNLCEFLNKPLSEIVKAQAILEDRKPTGRRYSVDYKQFALTLYFLGPRAYKLMGKVLCLPNKRSLQRMTEKLVCKPGLDNESIFTALEIKVKTMLSQDKHCTLCIDEMALKSNLFYHTGRDEIVGLTGGIGKDVSIAQNALVIMARGLYSNWKQPIAYVFTSSQFGAKKLHPLIEQCVFKLASLGLHVEALVSDMGSNFIELANSLGVSQYSPEFEIAGTKMIYLFDTCHLIKATRNNLIKNVFSLDEKKTSWSFVEEYYNRDKQQFYRSAPKLTNSHIYPSNFEKMKVRLAIQTLSHTVASGMNTYLSLGALPAEASTTIDVIEKFNKLFDLLNSSSLKNQNKFKNVFEGAEFQIDYMNEMVTFLTNLKILNKNGEDITLKCKFVKCWIIIINGIKILWEKLSSADFKYLQTRRVNTDCVENFFGSVRQQGGNCINPTPIQFERAFRKLFCQSYLHSNEMNCRDDLDELLMNLNALDVTVPESDDDNITEAISLPDYDYRKEEVTTQNAFNYVCGYLIKKSLAIHRCQICVDFSKKCEELDATKLFTYYKAYDTNKSIYGGLRVPCETFINYVFKLETVFSSMFDELSSKQGISRSYFNTLKNIEFTHPCPEFPYSYVLKLFIRMRIFYCLKYTNRNLTSTKHMKKNRKLSILSHL